MRYPSHRVAWRRVGWRGTLAIVLLLGATGPAPARDYCLSVAVTQCQSLGSGNRTAWAADPPRAAAATLTLLRSLWADPKPHLQQYATGQDLELPTRRTLKKALQALQAEAQPGDRVTIYLATAVVRDAQRGVYLLTDDAVLGGTGGAGGRTQGESAQHGPIRRWASP